MAALFQTTQQNISLHLQNIFTEPELAALNNLVEQYLVFAQGQAMPMTDWIAKLDAFLTLNERDILTHAGGIAIAA
jgi:hypothetical protein